VRAHGDGKRLYSSTDLDRLFGNNDEQCERTQQCEKAKVLYARVSSEKQRPDLERQVEDLRRAIQPHQQLYEVIEDVGSGLNWHRQGLQTLLERIHKGQVGEVVVFHKDRLCRFGFELVEWIFTKAGVKLVVLGQDLASRPDDDAREQQELAEDLLSIVTVFVAKHNGRRSATNRKRRKEEAKAAARPTREEKKARKPPPEKKAKTKTKTKTTKKEEEEKPPVGRVRKIRLYPNAEERQKLTRWFGAARWTYNRCLEEVRDKGCKRTEKALRARVINADALEAGGEALAWLKEIPYDIRDRRRYA
jgi:predicted site-specific integrase-resolvase